MKKFVAVVCLLCCLASLSFARISKGEERYGLGFSATPGIADTASFRYWKKGEYGLEGLLGYNSYDNSTNASLIGAKYLKPVKDEKNLTAYWFVMLGLLNESVAGTSASGTLIEAGLGAEFFLDELPNIGFNAEMGLRNRSGDAYTGTKGTDLAAGSVTSIAVRYYFK